MNKMVIMKRKGATVLISIALALMFILGSAGVVSAVSYSIELPSEVVPGSTVQGTIYFTDGSGEQVSAFSAYIVSSPSVSFVGDISVNDEISDIADPMVSAKKVDWISVSGTYDLVSDKVLLGTFNFTAPTLPGSYTVTIANDSGDYPTIATNLGTYSNNPLETSHLPLAVTSAGFTIARTIPEIYLQVEVPNEISAGETVEGSVYILGGKNQVIEGYTIALLSDSPSESLNLKIKNDPTPLGNPTRVSDAEISFVSSGSGSAITLDSDKILVCKFTITAPSSPLNTTYTVGFDGTKTEVITSNYAYADFDDGDATHVHTSLLEIPGIFTVPGSGSTTIGLDIVLPESVVAGAVSTGEVYLVGGNGQKLTGLQMYLDEAGSESLGISIVNEEGKILGYGTTLVSGGTFVYEDTTGITLDSARVKVCEFIFTVPGTHKQNAYAIDFLFTPAESKDTRVYTENAAFGKTDYESAGKTFTYLQSSGDAVYIGEEIQIQLIGFNGYFTDKSGAYIKNASTGLNISDAITGQEYADVTPTVPRFNSSIKAEMKYSCPASASIGGVIDAFTQQPEFYSLSTASLKMNASTVEVFDANSLLLGSGTGSFVNGKYQHTAVIPASASYLNVTFTGRKLGDVDGNGAINAFDSLKINKKVAHKLDFSAEDSFFGDFDQNKNINAFDSLGVNKKVAHKDTYWWV